jgi:superfamily II DNA or RNA helicase
MHGTSTDYASFVATKTPRVPSVGFEPRPYVAPLFQFQADIVRLACMRGRFCIWADCGMGKTAMQLEWAHQVVQHTGGRVLVLAPIAVGRQTAREAEKFGIAGVQVVHTPDEIYFDEDMDAAGQPRTRIVVTNYERLHHFDSADYVGVVLDESSILKAYDGKTRTAIIEAFAATPYRLACSATPAPNDYMELGNHAEFVGVMTRAEMLAMFFTHDGGDTSQWRLKGHAEGRYWSWVCTWAATLRKPSDLGYEDGGFQLPPLVIRDHVLDTISVPTENDDGQASLFASEARSLTEQRQVQRGSLAARVAEACAIANGTTEQVLVWCHLNDESRALAAGINGAVEVTGSDSEAHKEAALLDFQQGRIRVLVSKPSLCGFGMNFQMCARVIFVGLSHSYEAFYQAIRRCWRFGQSREVQAHVIYDWAEGAVVENLRRKEAEAAQMSEAMVAVMRETTMSDLHAQTTRTETEYATGITHGESWRAYLGDCVDVVGGLIDDSMHYSIFSPPFASLYTYSNSDRDMGNCNDAETFMRHFQFLIRELHRALMPGRLVSFHCMNLPSVKARDGVIGIKDFRGDLIRAFEAEGFIFHSEVCIWKDPVTAMQRTKAIGLLHKQIVKDSAMSRQGIPDYLVTMRKRGDNPEPVKGVLDRFDGIHPPLPSGDPVRDSINIWQRYASPVWMDINPSDTLQFRHAREEEDERHICPLQLGVIRRGIQLWSNPGDTVLSPFMGIGSEGYVAIQMGRQFVGAELKESYYKVALDNLRLAERTVGGGLFADATDAES